MRMVAAGSLQVGMKLARPLYRKAEILLAGGITLNERYINAIKRCGFSGVYVDDDLSSDIEIEPLISDDLRIDTAQRLMEIRKMAKMGDNMPYQRMPNITRQVEDIVYELCKNRDLMVNMMELSSYDNYTYSHSLNVTVLSVLVGASMELSRNDLVGLGTGALLHDIGKTHINKRILMKNGSLTDEEYEIVKQHPQMGYDYISKRYRQLPTKYLHTILDHHERFDGTGYPNGKQGNSITIFGRICAVADAYDALSAKRPHREAFPVYECVEYIMAGAHTQFDPAVVNAFVRRIAPYPLGTSVKLSNGWGGLVLENYHSCCLRPKLRIYQQDGQRITPFEISLKDDPNYLNVTIVGVT